MNSFPSILQISDEPGWQHLLSHTVNDPEELLDLLELPHSLLKGAQQGDALFPLKVPRPFIEKMAKGNPCDPLLRQVLPLGEETLEVPGFTSDPLEESESNPLQGIIHKYNGRVLLILSGACAVNCRYCFRREFPYGDNQLGADQWTNILDYLKRDPSIHEVIFSGGDPLATSDSRLQRMITDLEQIPHLTRLRIHSRLPIVIPQRITDKFAAILGNSRFNTVMVLHANHANELDKKVAAAVQRLKDKQITVLNQSVLLKGVNDCLDSLVQLSESLFEHGILPYYLFTLDPVKGAAHFNVADNKAAQLHHQMQSKLPGYLVPKLAREIPGRPSKTLILHTN